MILIKVQDKGLGMSKIAQKSFENSMRAYQQYTQCEEYRLGLYKN
jgi:hypothetical protein